MDNFQTEVADRVAANGADPSFRDTADAFLRATIERRYSYNFSWSGRPIIQYPQDIVAMQELIFSTRPDLIIETGIAHGGSLIFSASILALLDMYDAIENGITFDPRQSNRKVLGLDIDVRPHNRAAIEAHPLASRIEMLVGSSVAPDIVERVHAMVQGHERVLVCLDSNHTHEHVAAELEAYAPLVTVGSYCVVFDTVVEDLPPEMFPDRPWGPGDNPKTAVHKYLETHREFEIDRTMQDKLMITVAPDGFLKRIG